MIYPVLLKIQCIANSIYHSPLVKSANLVPRSSFLFFLSSIGSVAERGFQIFLSELHVLCNNSSHSIVYCCQFIRVKFKAREARPRSNYPVVRANSLLLETAVRT